MFGDKLADDSQTAQLPGADRRRVAIAANGFAGPRDRVQGEVARRMSVGVRARVEQCFCQLEVSVLDRQDQGSRRRHCVAARLRTKRFVYIDARFDKFESRVQASFSHGEKEWSETGVQGLSKICAAPEKGLDYVCIPLGRRPHDRSLLSTFASVYVCTMREQSFHRGKYARSGRGHQRCLSALYRAIWIGTGIE